MKTYKNDYSEIYAADSYDRIGLHIHSLQLPDARAQFAMDLVKHVAMARLLDGHPGTRTPTSAELAATACDLAAATFAEVASRGWVVNVPAMSEIKDDARENRGKN